MLACFAKKSSKSALPLHVVPQSDFETWLDAQDPNVAAWMKTNGFELGAGQVSIYPGSDGTLGGAVLIADDPANPWTVAGAVQKLPKNTEWRLEGDAIDPADACLGWALQSYRYERYQPSSVPAGPKLQVGAGRAEKRASRIAEAIYLGRDLVNTPAADMGPDELEDAVSALAKAHNARLSVTDGKKLERNFPMIHAVGKGSDRRPRLLDLQWGKAKAPKLTLVGKGVCFDSGGLNIKPGGSMLLMKKDMGGAAMTIALADAIMALKLDVRLRLLIPAVENSISGSSFRPGDVLTSRKGLTVEIGNTDAEGRLVLGDALDLADEEEPDLMIDAATLTGAARVALGPELPALFTPSDSVANDILNAGLIVDEPLWRLPLHEPYRSYIKSPIADINNAGSKPLAGAITAALFLKSFVTRTNNWAHLDIFGYNDQSRPGRPQGGEAVAMRALLHMIEHRFGPKAGS